jgi:hypothetical protein
MKEGGQSVPLVSSRLLEPLGQRIRRLLRLLMPNDELLVPQSNGDAGALAPL